MSIFCKHCNEEHPEEEFFLCKNKSCLSDGSIKIYNVYRCKKIVLAKQKKYT
ncbi:MAG: hypothetical protein Edafosvirus10_13 [Edafosvirus sp.]|uniref:Uncharacterized protein n=1 Tax=Edafosvirus sp. TaxID=2487765 RepID=A0A3G4ZTW1_9VIRU|nr:MAG: hypothetical protein Edafosvirus10_13 [Edafosvirus sp.]